MKSRPLAACMMIAALGIASLASAASPQNSKQVTRTRAVIVEAAGSASAAEADYDFQAKSYIDFDGTRAGFVLVESFGALYTFVTCTGPEFANVVSLNQNTGAVTVNANIDPSNPNCTSVNYSSGPLTLNVSGQFSGAAHISQSGTTTERYPGSTIKVNFQSEEFSENFSGSTGLYTGVFTGRAVGSRSTNRTVVK